MTKRITLALAMIGLSASAFAGAPGNQVAMPTGVNLTAPDSVGVWSFGIEALYVKPANNQFQYGQLNTDTTATIPTFKNKSVSNDHEWGGTVDMTYMFPGSSRDVKLSYTHIDFSNSSNTTVGANQSFDAGDFNNAFDTEGDYAKGSQDTDVDSVDLVFGQWIRIGQRVDLHPFGGLRYADIRTDDKGTYSDVSTDPATVSTQKFTSDFQGIGPRVGMDTAVHLGQGFSIVGTMAGSLLIGSNNSKFNVYDATGSIAEQDIYKNGSSTTVVPELDARIGVDYMYAFTPETSMNVQLGWQVVNYFDVTDTDAIDAVSPNTVNNSEDFGYQGPYLRLQVNLA
jgi:hypothetical protein